MFSSAFKSYTSNITSNYELAKQPTASPGVWQIFDAKKKSTGTPASVFVFSRKVFDTTGFLPFEKKSSSTSIRLAQDEVVEQLKKEASNLARLRHPSILQLLEPVEETRSGGLMFATEQVIAPLSNALRVKDHASSAGSDNPLDIDELEIQKGLLQVAKGLEFLHDSAKLVHGNICPDAIYINAKSDWKISGLGLAGPPDNAEGHQTLPQIALSEALYRDPNMPTILSIVKVNLDYTSPDFVMDSNISYAADIFSLGLVMVACYRQPHSSPLETHGNKQTYKKLMSSPSTAPGPANNYGSKTRLPVELENTLARVLARRPAQRMSAAEFQQSEYFDNILVNTMRFLDGFPAKTPAEKQQFMRGLTRVMPQFPASILEKKILSVLLEEMKDRELLSLILQNVFQIVNMLHSPRDVLAVKVLPTLKDIFTAQAKTQERDTGKEAGLVVYLENIKLMADNSSAQQFKEDVLPVVHVAMQSTTHSLVDAALGTLPLILPVLDFSTVKHDLFPVIASVFTKTSSLGIKVRGLEALAVLCGASEGTAVASHDDLSGISNAQETTKANTSSLDKFTMQEKVLPLLKGIKTKEPAVMMTALKVFQQIAKVGDIEFLASEVMPLLWVFALGPLLDLSQFKAHMDVIQALTQRIQREQIKKLQELATVNRSVADSRERSMETRTKSPLNGTGADVDFHKLVLSERNKDTSDPFSGALDDGQKLVATPGHSWQTSSGRATPATNSRMGSSTLQPAQTQSRSITPDISASSFPSLQPNTSSSAPWSQQQPQVSPVPSWNQAPMSQIQRPAQPTQQNSWNQVLAPHASSNTTRLQATSFLSSQPAVAASQSGMNSAFSPMLSPPPQSPPANAWQQQPFAIPPVNQQNTQQRQTQPQQQQPPKSGGLDKYQSLL